MRFKARLKSGEYLTDFIISPRGVVLQRNAAGVEVVVEDVELIPVVETKSFCKFCGARGKHD